MENNAWFVYLIGRLRTRIVLLLRNVRRSFVSLKKPTQKAPLDHRHNTGQEVTDMDMARYLACLKTAPIAAEALYRPELVTSLDDLERGPEAGNTGGGCRI